MLSNGGDDRTVPIRDSSTGCRTLSGLLWLAMACGPKAGKIEAAGEATLIRVTQVQTVPHRTPTSFPSAQERFANLDFELLSHPELSPDAKSFIEAVQAIVEGQPDAVARIDALTDNDDEAVRELARRFRSQLHYDAGTYQAMRDQQVAWGETPGPYVNALAGLPTPRLEGRTPITSQMTLGAFGLPELELEANGTEQKWVWDTGADFTLLPESLARELGVTMDATEVKMSTSTSQEATTRFGVLERLEVGGVTVYDSAVVVLPDSGLRWEGPDGEVFSISGVLGWNIIRHTRTEIDYLNGRYEMELSRPREYPERNFFWLGYPILQLVGPEGQPLAFGYDSGSEDTTLKPNFETKVPLGKMRRRRNGTAGAGGIEFRRLRIADSISFVLSGHRFDIPDVVEQANDTANDTPFVELDGVIGSDIAQTCVVTLDAKNGFFGMVCPSP